jgi:ABC-2 type transport system permease protein
MFAELKVVAWKEARTFTRQHGSRLRLLLTLLAPVMVLGIYLPMESGGRLSGVGGEGWLNGPLSASTLAVAVVLVALTIPDAFAGERERHTLETLLASPLSDRSLLLGKIGFAAGLAWLATLSVLLISLVSVNVRHGQGELLFYAPVVLVTNVVLSLLLSIAAAAVGTLVSLRSPTAQVAQQSLMALGFLPLFLVGMIPPLLRNLRPEWLEALARTIGNLGGWGLFGVLFLALAGACAATLTAAAHRFRRDQLLLARR